MMSAVVSSANVHVKRPEQVKRVIYVDIKTGEQVLIINKTHSGSIESRSSSVSSSCSTPVHSRPSSAGSSQSTDSSSSSSPSEKSRNLKGTISKYLCGTSPTQVIE